MRTNPSENLEAADLGKLQVQEYRGGEFAHVIAGDFSACKQVVKRFRPISYDNGFNGQPASSQGTKRKHFIL